MPKPLLNQIERNVERNTAQDNIIKDIKNLFSIKKEKRHRH